jgi:hypothetical protein
MSLPYEDVDFDKNYREYPEDYVVSSGQFGVLKYQPYKDEILPLWRYKNKEVAEVSSRRILRLFYNYLDRDEFVGADMAKKYLHMGFTRPMRYAKYPGGKKYDDSGEERTAHGPDTTGEWYDSDKREAAVTFRKRWKEARENKQYCRLKELHKSGELYEQSRIDSFITA